MLLSDLLHSGTEHTQATNNSAVIRNLGYKLTKMESDFQKLVIAFQNVTSEAIDLQMRVTQLESDRPNDNDPFRYYEMITKKLETKSNNFSKTVQEQSITTSALEGNLF